ncbi:interferon gamma isoform X2 [Stigmatopora argus]
MRGVAAAPHRHRGRHRDQCSGGPDSGETAHANSRRILILKMVAVARAMLGLCLCLYLCGVQNVPLTLNRTVQNLLKIYIPPKERFNGQPVFSRELLSTKMEAKEVLMLAVLQTYEEMLARMIHRVPANTPTVAPATRDQAVSSPDTRSLLNYLLKRVQDLRKYRYQAAEQLLHDLDKIRCVQVDDLAVQSKALWELRSLFRDARSLAENARPGKLRRRRRT